MAKIEIVKTETGIKVDTDMTPEEFGAILSGILNGNFTDDLLPVFNNDDAAVTAMHKSATQVTYDALKKIMSGGGVTLSKEPYKEEPAVGSLMGGTYLFGGK